MQVNTTTFGISPTHCGAPRQIHISLSAANFTNVPVENFSQNVNHTNHGTENWGNSIFYQNKIKKWTATYCNYGPYSIRRPYIHKILTQKSFTNSAFEEERKFAAWLETVRQGRQ